MPPKFGFVKHIIMDQCRRVNHLNHGPENVVGRLHVTARTSAQQQQSGAQSFAAIMFQMGEQTADMAAVTRKFAAEDSFDFRQIGRDRCMQQGTSTQRSRMSRVQGGHRVTSNRTLQLVPGGSELSVFPESYGHAAQRQLERTKCPLRPPLFSSSLIDSI